MLLAVAIAILAAPDSTERRPSAAWALSVHTAVCEIAWQQMDSDTRAFVNTVRRADPNPGQFFSESCAWADSVRNTTHRETYEYHYLNVVRGSGSIKWQRDCGGYDCVATAIIRYARQLARPPVGRRDSLQRAEALRFLGHFVGDLHQPLHAGYGDDLGGNLTTVTWNGAHGNLHAAWDTHIPNHAGVTQRSDGGRLAKEITASDAGSWRSFKVWDWASESYHLTRTQVYAFASGEDLSGAYAARMDSIAVRQLKKAGVRLAHLIHHAARGTLQLPKMP
jgi:hypothetical protein